VGQPGELKRVRRRRRVRRRCRPCRVVGQPGELKRVRRAETSPPTLSTVPGRESAGRAEVDPSGGIETAYAAVRVGSRGSAERPFAGVWVRQP